MGTSLKEERLGTTKYNNQGSLMKIIEYKDNKNIVIQFQDTHKYECVGSWDNFMKGKIKNPYYPTVCGVGMIGDKYPYGINGKNNKEYITWHDMLRRCFDEKTKEKQPNYKDATCCKEWLLFENFYEWLHSQKNFDKWLKGERWQIDKDILIKGNRIYSPDTCCLVPFHVNNLFKTSSNQSELPMGVYYNEKNNKKYYAKCRHPYVSSNHIFLGSYWTISDASDAYKVYKEGLIKEIAQEEYDKGNIIEECYRAMMDYEIETKI